MTEYDLMICGVIAVIVIGYLYIVLTHQPPKH